MPELFQSTPPVKAATKKRSENHGTHTFQSTPPVKAATAAAFRATQSQRFQSTPPVKAATRADKVRLDDIFISIHAAREGGDRDARTLPFVWNIFQSTPPVKAATSAASDGTRKHEISIHAAREGGDQGTSINQEDNIYFNPRRP